MNSELSNFVMFEMLFYEASNFVSPHPKKKIRRKILRKILDPPLNLMPLIMLTHGNPNYY